MTSSPAEDPLDPHVSAAALHEARSRLLFTARAVQRAWLLAVGLTILLAVAAATLFAISLFVSPTYVLIWTVLLSAALFNVTRYWPQRVEAPGVMLAADEARRLRQSLDPHAPTWPGSVQLVPEPEITVGGRHPRSACRCSPAWRRRTSAAWSHWPLVRRRPRRTTPWSGARSPWQRATSAAACSLWRRASARPRGLSGRIESALVEFGVEHDRWLKAFRENAESSSTRDALSLHHRDLVVEGWQLMRTEWLDPSLERGCWHPAPFSSLRDFLAGAQAAGILDGALPTRPPRGPVVDLVETHELEVADVLLGERRADDLRTIDWSQHPVEVTVPSWRAIVDEALDVSRQLSGLSTPPTVEGVLGLVESGDLVAVARQVAPEHGFDEENTDWVTMSRWVGGYPTLLLTAVVGMAALDSVGSVRGGAGPTAPRS